MIGIGIGLVKHKQNASSTPMETFYILTEDDDTIITEDEDNLILEEAV